MAPMTPDADITGLLVALRRGDQSVWERLLPLVYEELRTAAHRQLRRMRPGETLGTTALVHETWLRLANRQELALADRTHFHAVAATAMRQIIIDSARRHRAEKRGGGQVAVLLDQAQIASPDRAAEFLALDEALTRLAELSTRPAQVVELRFFGGLSVEETAEVLGISPRTVKREWQKARAWLLVHIQADQTP